MRLIDGRVKIHRLEQSEVFSESDSFHSINENNKSIYQSLQKTTHELSRFLKCMELFEEKILPVSYRFINQNGN